MKCFALDSQRSVDTAIIGRFRKYETAVTAKRADLKMELTNGRAVNREPEIAFNHFRALSHCLLSLRRLRHAHSNYYSFFYLAEGARSSTSTK